MSSERTNTSSNDLPIAESTKIEKAAKTPLRRLKISLANRLGFSSNPNSPKETPPPKRHSINSPTLTKLDPKVYLDTQSNGFASRVVKYHEASEAKGREISNKTYRRPGDFPIVNLDKSEINLNKKQVNAPKMSKIGVAPPINLVSASNASARSAIFRTGKNYGDSYPIGKLGPIEGRKPIKPTLPQDEPIVPTSNDYDSAPIRSSLEALKEISRKRIHCDEIDGDTNKKQRGDALNEYDQNNAQAVNSSKRTRDRTSPSYSSSSAEVQKKRYKNNDILSSLSSSILISTPKRDPLSVDETPTKGLRPELNYNKRDANENASSDNYGSNKKAAESSRVGTSNSDLPLHRPSEQIKPVIKSMSDGYVPPSQPTTRTTKLTLFNKVYSDVPSTNEKKTEVIDDDDDNSISFVKPKLKTSTIFGANKNRDQKSKLAIMLSFLRGDESKDEVDCVQKPLISAEKPDQKEVETKTSSSSTPANLSTITSVTFSTATTTSVLNAPSNAIKSSIVGPPKVEPPKIEPHKVENNEISKLSESSSPSSGFILSTAVPPVSSNVVTTVTTTQNDKPQTIIESAIKSVPSPTVTFNLPVTQSIPASTVTLATQNTTSASDSTPRLGGFAFSASPPSFTSNLASKPATPESISSSKVEEVTKPAAPTFSFGLAKSTGNTTLPSFGAPTKSSTLPTNTGLTFGVPNSSVASSSTNVLGSNTGTATSTPSLFGFGAVPKTTASSTTTVTSTSATSAAVSSAFVFGSNTSSTPAPSFGQSNAFTNVTTTTASGTSIPNQAAPSFSFGGASNIGKPETSGFQFGNTSTNVTTSSLTFGSPSPSTGSAAPSTGLFGTGNTTNPTSTTQSAFAFGSNSNKPNTDANPLFGTPTTQQQSGFGAFATPKFGDNKTTTPTFGGLSSAVTTTSSTNLLFGSTQVTPVFGSSNISSTQQPKTENVFGTANNQSANTPVFGGQSQSNTFGKPTINAPTFGSSNSTTQNIFGSTPTTQSQPPTFGSSNKTSNSAFGSPATGMFAFGQSASQPAATTASTGSIFGTSNTNTNTTPNAPFVFGQSNIQPTTPSQQSASIFGAKPAENTNTALSAPPAFGSTSTAFNFTATAKPTFGNQQETKPAPFSFNASNNTPPNVTAFGSGPATAAATAPPSQFGATNGIGSSFSFGSTNSPPEASKGFNFGGPATAPAATAPAPFSFSAPNQNAFQFNTTPQPAANIFSIGPGSGTNAAKTGRPIRTAVRRMK